MSDIANDINDYCFHGTGHEGCCCDLKHIEPDAAVDELIGQIEQLQADKAELVEALSVSNSLTMRPHLQSESDDHWLKVDKLIAKHTGGDKQ